ncbi:MAG: hypothetical protein F6J87_14690 [Spirulina sp. SIO3F2]|nr:hypothetical protein [Spirulina sp. SIO3F2]
MQALIKALCDARKSFETIPKNKTAEVYSQRTKKKYSYQYADLADIQAATVDKLAAQGLLIIQTTEPSEQGLLLVTELWHTSGESKASRFPLPSDVTDPQQYGSLLTYHKRYQWCAMLGISPEEDRDAQDTSPDAHASNHLRPVSITSRQQPIASPEQIDWSDYVVAGELLPPPPKDNYSESDKFVLGWVHAQNRETMQGKSESYVNGYRCANEQALIS